MSRLQQCCTTHPNWPIHCGSRIFGQGIGLRAKSLIALLAQLQQPRLRPTDSNTIACSTYPAKRTPGQCFDSSRFGNAESEWATIAGSEDYTRQADQAVWHGDRIHDREVE